MATKKGAWSKNRCPCRRVRRAVGHEAVSVVLSILSLPTGLTEGGPVTLFDAKACKACGKVKALGYFYTDRRATDGRKGVCKECVRNGRRVLHACTQDCTFEGCSERQIAKGLCSAHWQQDRQGFALRPTRFRNSKLGFLDKKTCSKCRKLKGKPQFWTKSNGVPNSWCKDCDRKKNREWHVVNHERSRALAAAWARANPDRARELNEAYRMRHPERFLEIARKNSQNRRARLLKAGGRGLSLDTMERVMALTAGLCNYCDEPAVALDHFHPISKGGRHDEDNLVPACKSCNSSKHDSDPIDWIAVRKKICRVIPVDFRPQGQGDPRLS